MNSPTDKEIIDLSSKLQSKDPKLNMNAALTEAIQQLTG
jgi:hypothetical protein